MKQFEDFKAEALSVSQMRAVKGGSGTCAAISGSGDVITNVSKEVAQFWAVGEGAHWCCDNCNTASWL